MKYQINGLPNSWALCPPHVETWLKQLKNITGKRQGIFVIFKRKDIINELQKLRVPHVAEFMEKNTSKKIILFPVSACIMQEASLPFFKYLKLKFKKWFS